MSVILILAQRLPTKIYPLIILGCLYFLSFKTKEFTLFFVFAFPALGFTGELKFDWKYFLKRIGYVAIGGVLGVIIFMILSTIFLNNPFWGITPNDLLKFKAAIESFSSIKDSSENYITKHLFNLYMLPFILYLFSGISGRVKSSSWIKYYWLVPMALISFLTLSMIKSGWRVDERYIYTSIGLMCSLSPQGFDLAFPEFTKYWKKYSLVTFLAVIGLLLASFVLKKISINIGVDYPSFISFFINPVLFCILLSGLFIFDGRNWKHTVFLLMSIFALNYYVISSHFKTIIGRKMQFEVEDRLYPISTFLNDFEVSTDSNIHLSPMVLQHLIIKQDINEASGMFNFVLDTRLKPEQFTFNTAYINLFEETIDNDYHYILLTKEEWDLIQNENIQEWEYLSANFSVQEEKSDRFILLINQ